MTETTQACIRGCSLYNRHLSDCEDQDECRGCLPRRAEHGNLCWPCHRRLELMLTDAPTVYRWLTGNMGSGQGAARARQDYERGGGEGSPAPIKVDLFDQRQLLADRLALWADDLAETKAITGPEQHTVEADVEFLMTWLPGIERFYWIGDWFEELAETLSDAHSLAPWRPEVKRVSGIPCPECEETNLLIFGGESDVTCGSCRTIIPEKRYGIWESIIRSERQASA